MLVGVAPVAGQTLYFAVYHYGKIVKLTVGGTPTTLVEGLQYPYGIAFDSDGNLIVANQGSGTISRIARSGQVSPVVTGLNNPTGLAIDSSGNIYVSSNLGNVLRVTGAGAVSTFWRTSNNLLGLAFDPGGNLYVADKTAGAIRKITPAGVVSTFATVSDPLGVAFDSSGNLWVTQNAPGTICRVSPSGTVTSNVASGIQYPGLLAWDGTALFCGSGFGATYKISSAGEVTSLASVASGQLGAVAGVAIEPVVGPPQIQTQPQGQTAHVGDSATFTVGTTATPAPTFQWQRGGAAIAGATSATFRISGVQISDAGSYTVVVTNRAGSVTSEAATLTVDAAGITVASRSFSGDHLTNASRGTVTGVLVYGGQGTATNPSWSGKIVLLDRGTGTFYTKVHNVQLSGGLACVIANNVSGSLSGSLGEGNSATIPAITVSQEDGAALKTLVNSNATVSTLLIGVTPAITSQPQTQTAAAGESVTLSVVAAGAAPLGYQWQLNGANIPGATGATLAIPRMEPCAIGEYTVKVSNTAGSVTSSAAVVSMVPGRLINLSILTPIASGDPLTVGAVIGGKGVSGPLPLLIRGVGPSLTPLGVGGALADPKLEVFSGLTSVASNDDWGGGATLSAFAATLGAFPFSATTTKDAALSFGPNITAPPASYTVQLSGVGTAAGTALAEVYDGYPSGLVTAATPRLINMSVLKQIPATGTLTAGFVVGGGAPKQLLIRAIGPALGLAPFNVPGAMPDPKLTLFDAKGNTIASNDNWDGNAILTAAFAGAGAFGIPTTSRDAALLITLSPGNYTAQIAASTVAGRRRAGWRSWNSTTWKAARHRRSARSPQT